MIAFLLSLRFLRYSCETAGPRELLLSQGVEVGQPTVRASAVVSLEHSHNLTISPPGTINNLSTSIGSTFLPTNLEKACNVCIIFFSLKNTFIPNLKFAPTKIHHTTSWWQKLYWKKDIKILRGVFIKDPQKKKKKLECCGMLCPCSMGWRKFLH